MIKIFVLSMMVYIAGYSMGVTVSTPMDNVPLIKVFDSRFKKQVWTCPYGTVLGIVLHQGKEELRCLVIEIQ